MPESLNDAARDAMRLDKWLWAARFYKTRQLAIEAIHGGHIKVDGQRVKPSRSITTGARIEITKDGLSWLVEVLGLNKQRRPASEAGLLYREDETSRLRRQMLVRERRELGQDINSASGRPTKRDRRLIERFRNQGDPIDE